MWKRTLYITSTLWFCLEEPIECVWRTILAEVYIHSFSFISILFMWEATLASTPIGRGQTSLHIAPGKPYNFLQGAQALSYCTMQKWCIIAFSLSWRKNSLKSFVIIVKFKCWINWETKWKNFFQSMANITAKCSLLPKRKLQCNDTFCEVLGSNCFAVTS